MSCARPEGDFRAGHTSLDHDEVGKFDSVLKHAVGEELGWTDDARDVFERFCHRNGSIPHSRINAGGQGCLRRRFGPLRSALVEGAQPIAQSWGECTEGFVQGVGGDRGWKMGSCPS